MLSFFKLARLLLIGGLVLSSTACRDETGLDTWSDLPDTTVIFSLSRPELLGQPSAYDMINFLDLRVESPSASGAWDFALRHEGNDLALVPASGFPGQVSRAAFAQTNRSFEELTEAPADTTAFSSEPVIISPGMVMAVRTRRAPCAFSNSVRYGKLRVIEVDAAEGFVRFEAVRNPFCNDRSLVPPED